MIAGFDYKAPKNKPKQEVKAPTVMNCDCHRIAIPKRYNADLDPQDVIAAAKADGMHGKRGFQFLVVEDEVVIEKTTEDGAPVTQIQIEMLMSFCRGYMSARR